MAQRPGQSPHDSSWVNTFLPDFFNGTLNSPGVSALSSNNNGPGQYTSANPTLFQEAPNISSGSHQTHALQAPFSINSVNGTNSKVKDQRQELIEILLREAGPTKQQIQDNILEELKPVVKQEIKQETLEEINHLKGRLSSAEAEVKRLSSFVAEIREILRQHMLHLQRHPLVNYNNKAR